MQASVTFRKGLTSLKQDCKSPTVITVPSTYSAVCEGPEAESGCERSRGQKISGLSMSFNLYYFAPLVQYNGRGGRLWGKGH